MEEEVSLGTLFQQALTVCDSAEDSPQSTGRGSEYAVAWLQRCEEMVASLGLFSPNEEADDISTADLKYLLAPFFLAELQAKTDEKEPTARKEQLQAALTSYARFMHLAAQYDLVPAEAKADGPMDASQRRELKIARFKREKAAQARLAGLRQAGVRRERLSELDGEAFGSADGEASEGVRDAWLARIELAALKTAEQRSLLAQEVEMLSHAASLSPAERQKAPEAPPADLLRQLRSAAGNLESERARLAAGVFRPSHNLPTRSLREQAMIETEQAQRTAETQARAATARKERESDEDFQLAKQRAWDDWKDDNPRGAGNSRLRPTA